MCASQTCLCTLCGRRVFHVQAYAGCSRVRVSQVRCVGFCGDVAAKQHHTSVVSASCDHTIKAWSDIAGMWMCTRTFKVGARPANVCVRATEESGSDCCFLLNTSMGGGGKHTSQTRRQGVWIIRPCPSRTHQGFSLGWEILLGFVWQGHTDSVLYVKVSQDRTVMASCGLDGTARLWDWNTGLCFAILTTHVDAVQCLDISLCGRSEIRTRTFPAPWATMSSAPLLCERHLVTGGGSNDCTVLLWSITDIVHRTGAFLTYQRLKRTHTTLPPQTHTYMRVPCTLTLAHTARPMYTQLSTHQFNISGPNVYLPLATGMHDCPGMARVVPDSGGPGDGPAPVYRLGSLAVSWRGFLVECTISWLSVPFPG